MQRQEMDAVTRDYEATERENLRLLRNMELSDRFVASQSMNCSLFNNKWSRIVRSDRKLLKSLIDVEMQGQNVVQQMNVVRGLLQDLEHVCIVVVTMCVV